MSGSRGGGGAANSSEGRTAVQREVGSAREPGSGSTSGPRVAARRGALGAASPPCSPHPSCSSAARSERARTPFTPTASLPPRRPAQDGPRRGVHTQPPVCRQTTLGTLAGNGHTERPRTRPRAGRLARPVPRTAPTRPPVPKAPPRPLPSGSRTGSQMPQREREPDPEARDLGARGAGRASAQPHPQIRGNASASLQ